MRYVQTGMLAHIPNLSPAPAAPETPRPDWPVLVAATNNGFGYTYLTRGQVTVLKGRTIRPAVAK